MAPRKKDPNSKTTNRSKKAKEPLGEIEAMWEEAEKKKEAQKKAEENANKPPQAKRQLAIAEAPEPFFCQQVAHPYGTCWRCGKARKTAGGSPGGSEAYHCHHCDQWLPIRHSASDPPKLLIAYN